MPLVLAGLSITAILLVWFQTHAFTEYVSLCFGWLPKWVRSFFILDEFMKVKDTGLSYVDFLSEYFPEKFRARLMICPLCMAVWTSFVLSFIYGFSVFLPAISIGLFFYFAVAIMISHLK